MKKIYITGGWGYGNYGDNAILAGMLQSLKFRLKDSELIITSFDTNELALQNNVESIPSVHSLFTKNPITRLWHRFSYWLWRKSSYKWMFSSELNKHLEILKKSNVLLMGGGGYFNDAWPSMLNSKYAELELAEVANCPVMLYGQTIGPFSDYTIKNSLSKKLNKVSFISYRDAQSAETLKKSDFNFSNALLTADEANLLPVLKKNYLKNHDGKIVIGVMIQNFRPHLNVSGVSVGATIPDSSSYISEVVNALNAISSLMPCHFVFMTSTTWDLKTNQSVFNEIRPCQRSTKEFINNFDTDQFISICQHVDVMLSTNMHPIILATTAHKPSVALSYHYKLDDYMESVGQRGSVLRIDNFSSDTLKNALLKVVENRFIFQVNIQGQHGLVKDLAKLNCGALLKLLDINEF